MKIFVVKWSTKFFVIYYFSPCMLINHSDMVHLHRRHEGMRLYACSLCVVRNVMYTYCWSKLLLCSAMQIVLLTLIFAAQRHQHSQLACAFSLNRFCACLAFRISPSSNTVTETTDIPQTAWELKWFSSRFCIKQYMWQFHHIGTTCCVLLQPVAPLCLLLEIWRSSTCTYHLNGQLTLTDGKHCLCIMFCQICLMRRQCSIGFLYMN
jgi:hypothetical protein